MFKFIVNLFFVFYLFILNQFAIVSIGNERRPEVIFNGRRLLPFIPVTDPIIWLYSFIFMLDLKESC